eukprot:scaffold48765_cov31-Attheya_sp.AAC.1
MLFRLPSSADEHLVAINNSPPLVTISTPHFITVLKSVTQDNLNAYNASYASFQLLWNELYHSTSTIETPSCQQTKNGQNKMRTNHRGPIKTRKYVRMLES